MLSGDWHHYSRYESLDAAGGKRQLITSGGGGAYMLGTHRLPMTGVVPPTTMRPPKTPSATYRLKERFPTFGRSLWLGLGGILRTPLRNWLFVLLLGALQFLLLFALQRSSVSAGAEMPMATDMHQVSNTPAVIGTWMLYGLLTFFLAAGLSGGKRSGPE